MNKTTKIITISFGIVGSLFLCTGLIGSIFSIKNIDAQTLYRIALPFLFAFFMASAFIFSKTNNVYKISRGLNALAMSLAVSLVVLNVKDINPNFVFTVISGSMVFYNICDFLFRKIKLPQIFVLIPMIVLFIIELVNYSKDKTSAILLSTIGITLLFVMHLISKSLPILKMKETKN
ncbi:MAG: hypothetical protein E7184_01115 [Erysipelotrichaceae bacterium]|nr:hypothetical protein [Erysipelotrichaceae bacterium]